MIYEKLWPGPSLNDELRDTKLRPVTHFSFLTYQERDGTYYIWSYTSFKKLILVIQQLSLLSFAATRTHRSFSKWIIARQVCNSRKMCPKSMHHGIAEATVYEVPSFIAQTCIKRSSSDEVYQIRFWGNDSTITIIRIFRRAVIITIYSLKVKM